MPTTNHLSTELATLDYISEHGIVHHRLLQPISGEAFRTVLNTGVELLRKHGAIKWLSDDRGNSALSAEDTDWTLNTWFPMAKEAGWQVWALVVPEDVYARMNLAEHIDWYNQRGLRIMVFTNPSAALEWLIKVPEPIS